MAAPDTHTRLMRLATMAGITAGVVALDQATKAAVRAAGEAGQLPRTLIPGVLDLKLVYNTGAAFSFGAGGGATWFFALVAVIIFVGVAFYLCAEENLSRLEVVSLCAVAAGGIGNLIDRLMAGQVTDFLATTFIDFPVFNVADIAVTCGVIVMLACVLFRREG